MDPFVTFLLENDLFSDGPFPNDLELGFHVRFWKEDRFVQAAEWGNFITRKGGFYLNGVCNGVVLDRHPITEQEFNLLLAKVTKKKEA